MPPLKYKSKWPSVKLPKGKGSSLGTLKSTHLKNEHFKAWGHPKAKRMAKVRYKVGKL